MMGPDHAFGVFHLLVMLVAIAAYGVPLFKIIQKAGFSGWWFLISLVPILNLVMLWIFAFADWPNVRRSETK